MEHNDPFSLGVGIIGANPQRGWASRAHMPAIAATRGVTLQAVCTSRPESAEEARRRFGAAHAFNDPVQLAGHPAVDLVVVTVRVSAHYDLVTAALDAGKHVFCEWPLATDVDEARVLADLADRRGVRTFVGLQARFDPAVASARRYLDDGRLGRITSATVHTSRNKGSERAVPAWTAYTYDAAQGAGLVDVLGGHALDLAEYLLGPLDDISARTALHTRDHVVAGTGQRFPVSAPDHLQVLGRTSDGALVSLVVHDGDPAIPGSRIEITATKGKLLLSSVPTDDPWTAQLQMSPMEFRVAERGDTDWTLVAPAADDAAALPVQAANVARLYSQIVTDISRSTHVAPDFRDAADLHAKLPRPGRHGEDGHTGRDDESDAVPGERSARHRHQTCPGSPREGGIEDVGRVVRVSRRR